MDKIRELISSLPERDIHFGNSFLNGRDFESLKDLVDSAIIRTTKNIKSPTPKEEYLNVNMEELTTLQAEVAVYMLQLEVPSQEGDENDNYYE